MKTMKRLGCILLVVAMCLALGVSAMAAEGDYTITVNAQTGDGNITDLDGYTFYAYQIFSGTVEVVNGQEVLEGIQWGEGFEGLLDVLTSEDESNPFNSVQGGNPFAGCTTAENVADVLSGWNSDNYYNENGTWVSNSSLIDTFAEVVAQYIADAEKAGNAITSAGSATGISGATSVTIDVSNTGAGYYIVLNTKVPNSPIENDSASGAYSFPILQVLGQEEATIKADVPEVTKEIVDNDQTDVSGATSGNYEENSYDPSQNNDRMDYSGVTDNTGNEAIGDVGDYDIGTDIWFQLTGTFPTDYAKYDTYKMIFHDVEGDGLTFDPNSVVVYVVNGESWYKVSSDCYIVSTSSVEDGCTFEVSFTDTKTLYDTNSDPISTDKDSKIVVQYKSTLNSEAVIGNDGNPNEVYLEFTNDSLNNGTGRTTPDKVIGFTFGLKVNKVGDDEDNTPLKGAKFILYRDITDDSGTTTRYYATTTTTNASDQTVITEWTAGTKDSDGNWVAPIEAYVMVTDENGNVSVAGLDEGTYYLLETEAPEGYNMLTDPVMVTITATYVNQSGKLVVDTLTVTVEDSDQHSHAGNVANSSSTANGDSETGIVEVTIENHSGATLPSTGGIGTTIFYIVGAILVCGAVVLLVTRKRVGKEEG